jgi:aerobic carbon-monoxide dehydrogenase medium subunit
MLAADFQFFAPTELSDALGLLEEHGDGAKILAGGMSMMPAVNLGILRPTTLVSFNHIPGLDSVEDDGDALRIGAMVRHERILSDPLIRRHAGVLSDAARVIADVQVRNRGTIGGSVAHADPAADYLPVLVALDADIRLGHASGERTVKAREFFVDVMMTALEPGEAVLEIRVPKAQAGTGASYLRLARVEGSFAIVNAAAVVSDERSVVAIGGAVPAPVVFEAPVPANGDSSSDSLARIGDAAYAACEDAYGDLSGSPGYRRAMARILAQRAVAQALERRVTPNEGAAER